jgi:CRISPR-associated protein Cas2
MARKTRYLVCYDICGPDSEKRLRKVYKTMRGYGEHVQYSVFRCELTELQLARLEQDMELLIDHHKDQVMIAPLGYADRGDAWTLTILGIPLSDPERIVRIV